jgi:hypothetical protein
MYKIFRLLYRPLQLICSDSHVTPILQLPTPNPVHKYVNFFVEYYKRP